LKFSFALFLRSYFFIPSRRSSGDTQGFIGCVCDLAVIQQRGKYIIIFQPFRAKGKLREKI